MIHDGVHEGCIKILSDIISIMKPGYSRIQRDYLMLQTHGAHFCTTAMYLELMLAGKAGE